MEAAQRRLQEEMGMKCELDEKFYFEYKSHLDNALTEWELDHVLIGVTDSRPQINKEEVKSYLYMSTSEIAKEIKSHPEKFTEWFKICFERVVLFKKNAQTSQ
jgi:isopentenyl-diphosphate Delta-isomerase